MQFRVCLDNNPVRPFWRSTKRTSGAKSISASISVWFVLLCLILGFARFLNCCAELSICPNFRPKWLEWEKCCAFHKHLFVFIPIRILRYKLSNTCNTFLCSIKSKAAVTENSHSRIVFYAWPSFFSGILGLTNISKLYTLMYIFNTYNKLNN